MKARVLGTVIALLPAIFTCSSPASSRESAALAVEGKVFTAPPPSFVNRVWVVAESKQVAPGELRAFLSEGTLIMASPHGRPALGSWSYQDGQLTITEDGLKYEVDILELSEDAFQIRIHNPGEPVDIRFTPAERVPVATNSVKRLEAR